jgi:Fic family protein
MTDKQLKKMTKEEKLILSYLREHPQTSAPEMHQGLLKADESFTMSLSTLKRRLSGEFMKLNLVLSLGKGKGLKYALTPEYSFVYPIDMDEYFNTENRNIFNRYNFNLMDQLEGARLFSDAEMQELQSLQGQYEKNISQLTPAVYQMEMERLSIDLTWKSSQIEGNTYSLLDTEILLKELQTAKGKTIAEASMLLNHKKAIDFLLQNPDFFEALRIRDIEDIHSILVEKLDIQRNLRNELVRIGGTDYQPLDNEHQIREALQDACRLINGKKNIFEKALLALILLSYIQAFMDGNKRVARIVANGILISNRYCLISFRTVEPSDYKKAMLIFYEQNNLSAFKRIFIEQFKFAVGEYFRVRTIQPKLGVKNE